MNIKAGRLLLTLCLAGNGFAQVNNMFGLDMEGAFECSLSSCPTLDFAIQAHAASVRIFVPWNSVEPNAPTGYPQAGVNGQMSGQHSYNWGTLDNQIPPAINRGLKVYAQIYWTAAWGNGNSSYPMCDPVTASSTNQCYVKLNGSQYVQCGPGALSGCTPVGNPQGRPASQTVYVSGAPVSASLALQDFAYNLAVRYPQVQSFGPINEPNYVSNYNPLEGGYTGNYLNDFMNYLVNPVRSGIKAANSANLLVGPDVSLNGGAANGMSAFLKPLNQYFGGSFDVWSVHSYHSDHSNVRGDMDSAGSAVGYNKPFWLTETGFQYDASNDQAAQVQTLYVDEYNRINWWQTTFYHFLQDYPGATTGNLYGLIDQYGNIRPSFNTYRSIYGR